MPAKKKQPPAKPTHARPWPIYARLYKDPTADRKTVRNWAALGAPLDDPAKMPAWWATTNETGQPGKIRKHLNNAKLDAAAALATSGDLPDWWTKSGPNPSEPSESKPVAPYIPPPSPTLDPTKLNAHELEQSIANCESVIGRLNELVQASVGKSDSTSVAQFHINTGLMNKWAMTHRALSTSLMAQRKSDAKYINIEMARTCFASLITGLPDLIIAALLPIFDEQHQPEMRTRIRLALAGMHNPFSEAKP